MRVGVFDHLSLGPEGHARRILWRNGSSLVFGPSRNVLLLPFLNDFGILNRRLRMLTKGIDINRFVYNPGRNIDLTLKLRTLGLILLSLCVDWRCVPVVDGIERQFCSRLNRKI